MLFLSAMTFAAPPASIAGAFPNLAAGTLTVVGTGFDPQANVALSGTPLAVQSATPTRLVVTLPQSLAPGTYRLVVGHGGNANGADDAALDITIGAAGPVGPLGPQGPAGVTGSLGPMGPIGPVGAAGATGAQGPQGAAGPTGPQGATGSTGQQGPKGLTGDTGSSVRASATPYDGTPDGVDFAVCLSNSGRAFEIVDAAGNVLDKSRFVVCDGAAGVDGKAGSEGPTGATGPAGPAGADASGFGFRQVFVGSTLVTSTPVAIGSITATVPSAGTALVLATGQCTMAPSTMATTVRVEVNSVSALAVANTVAAVNITMGTESVVTMSRPFSVSRTFTLTAPGRYQLFLNGQLTGGSGATSCYAGVTFLFTPTALAQ
ncbi:MAG TPA: IPT/TIG domain-containing protein [Vicinamibacterales bacterium]|nr:IPT/TIG domain-containing protein [Vicinamibacterales bacterium]